MAYGSDFEGASFSRFRRQNISAAKDSKDSSGSYSRRTMLSRARWLFNNFGLAKGAVKDIARYSVGSGIVPQSQISDADTRQAYEDYFRQWSGICEITGKFNFNELLHFASISADVDGDIGVILTETPTRYPLLQLIESHRIRNADNAGARDFDGVKVDDLGRPISYTVTDGVNGDSTKTIEARSFCLISEFDRSDELRGKTRFHAAINRLQDVWEVLEAETNGIKLNSKIALAIKTKQQGNAFFGKKSTRGDVDSGQMTVEQIFDGAIVNLDVGEDMTAHNSDRPSPTFTGYLDFLIRDIAVGLGLPPEFIWNPDKLGGTGNRFVLEKASRRFAERQQLLIKFATRVWGYVVSKGVKRGDIPASDEWWKVRWQTPSKITVDVGREAMQNREDILLGIRTEQEDAAERGVDIDDLRLQRKQEATQRIKDAQEIAKKTGVSFEVALMQLSRRTPNGNLPTTSQGGNAP
jgi:capsid protein